MEKEKNNKGLIIVLSILVVLLAVLCVLFATGTISFNFKTSDYSTNNTENNVTQNNITQNNIENTTLTNSDAISIIKKLYSKDVRELYNEAVAYCGERETGEGSHLSIDGFGYTKSKSFKNLKELEEHLKTYMTESLLSSSNYNKSVTLNEKNITSYVEKNGALYCNDWNKGSNMELAYYIENESSFEVNNISETSFEASINAVYYDVDYETNKSASARTVKKIKVTVIKENNSWLLDKYSELS